MVVAAPRRPPRPDPHALVLGLARTARLESLSMRALARRAGVDHTVVVRAEAGLAHFGADSCARIAAAYPELRGAAAAYLATRYRPQTLRLLAEAAALLPEEASPPITQAD